MTSDVATQNLVGQKMLELNIPDVFDIKYMYRDRENTYLNKISTCSLTGMNVQYGGDSILLMNQMEVDHHHHKEHPYHLISLSLKSCTK